MLVAVDVEGADVGCSANEVNFDLSGWTGFWVVGFWSVVAIGWFAAGFVDSDESDLASRSFETLPADHTQGSARSLAAPRILAMDIDQDAVIDGTDPWPWWVSIRP